MGCTMSSASMVADSSVRPDSKNNNGRRASHSTTQERAISKFVPYELLERVQSDNRAIDSPVVKQTQGAMVFVDIKGFTRLSETLVANGGGAERLIEIINRYFSDIITTLVSHGADIERFAGDAIITIFQHRNSKQTLQELAVRAVQCAMEIQHRHASFGANVGLSQVVTLSLHVAVACGDISYYYVGGGPENSLTWRHLVDGKSIFKELKTALELSNKGQTIVAKSVFDQVKPFFQLKHIAENNYEVERIYSSVRQETLQPVQITDSMEPTIRQFVDAFLLSRIDSKQFNYLAELRELTSVFIGIDVTSSGQPEHVSLHTAIQTIQRVLLKYEGSIGNCLTDEKGTSVLAIFGFPVSHSDDSTRSIKACAEIQKMLDHVDIKISFGIATGSTFCGLVGSDQRMDFSVFSSTVNLSSRLLGISSNSILCDKATAEKSSDFVNFKTLPAVQLKGMEEEVQVFEYVDQKLKRKEAVGCVVGRENEVHKIAEVITQLRSTGKGTACVITGASGMGKTEMVSLMMAQHSSEDVIHIVETADEIQRDEYEVWKAVFPHFKGENGYNMDSLLDGSEAPYLACLNAVLNTRFEETIKTKELTKQERVDKINQLATAMLHTSMVNFKRRIVLILEDFHFFDDSSEKLLFALLMRVPQNMCVIVTSREVETPGFKKLLGSGLHIPLYAFDEQQVHKLMAKTLKVATVSSSVTKLIHQKTNGNPHFINELVDLLLQREVITILGNSCDFAMTLTNFDDIGIPNSVTSLIQNKIDKLDNDCNLVLKIASIIGRRFHKQTIAAILPDIPAKQNLNDVLDRLVSSGMVTFNTHDELYYFQNQVHIVGYNVITDNMKREFHMKLAKHLVNSCGFNREKVLEIAWHSFRALEGNQLSTKEDIWEAIENHEQALEKLKAERSWKEHCTVLKRYISLLEMAQEDPRTKDKYLQAYYSLSFSLVKVLVPSQEEVGSTLRKAKELCPEENPIYMEIIWALWFHDFLRDRKETYENHVEQLLAYAEKANDDLMIIEACYAASCSYYSLSIFDKIVAPVQKAIEIYSKDPTYFHGLTIGKYNDSDPIALCGQYLIRAQWVMGNHDDCLQTFRMLEQFQKSNGQESTEGMFLTFSCYYFALEKCSEDLETLARGGYELASERANRPVLVQLSRIYLAFALALQGKKRVSDALEDIKDAFAVHKKYSTLNIILYWVYLETYLLQDDSNWDEAIQIANEAIDLRQTNLLPEIYRLKAEIFIRKAVDNTQEIMENITMGENMAKEFNSRTMLLRLATTKLSFLMKCNSNDTLILSAARGSLKSLIDSFKPMSERTSNLIDVSRAIQLYEQTEE